MGETSSPPLAKRVGIFSPCMPELVADPHPDPPSFQGEGAHRERSCWFAQCTRYFFALACSAAVHEIKSV
jgi:hypothetical protein